MIHKKNSMKALFLFISFIGIQSNLVQAAAMQEDKKKEAEKVTSLDFHGYIEFYKYLQKIFERWQHKIDLFALHDFKPAHEIIDQYSKHSEDAYSKIRSGEISELKKLCNKLSALDKLLQIGLIKQSELDSIVQHAKQEKINLHVRDSFIHSFFTFTHAVIEKIDITWISFALLKKHS